VEAVCVYTPRRAGKRELRGIVTRDRIERFTLSRLERLGSRMLWLRALHIIFVVCWFAGLFYLPRIFVYYAASEHAETRAQLAVMSRRLYRFVTPFMVLTVGLRRGLIAVNPDYYLSAPGCG
jgi:uncharacterized membrane protein